MILIVGLGNPGREYEQSRHNIGFMVIDKFLEILDVGKLSRKFNSLTTEITCSGKKILIQKPFTFMNNSGAAVLKACKYYKDNIDSILVVHDDLDIEFGEIRLKSDGGAGGHNGLESIIAALGNGNFDRLRFGIGRPPGRKDPSDFVLSSFKKSEKSELEFLADRAVDALKDYIEYGIQYSMNKYN